MSEDRRDTWVQSARIKGAEETRMLRYLATSHRRARNHRGQRWRRSWSEASPSLLSSPHLYNDDDGRSMLLMAAIKIATCTTGLSLPRTGTYTTHQDGGNAARTASILRSGKRPNNNASRGQRRRRKKKKAYPPGPASGGGRESGLGRERNGTEWGEREQPRWKMSGNATPKVI